MLRTLTGVALLALAATQALTAAVTISGSVLDETGNPVAGARVLAGTAAATTDAAGIFRIELPAPGDYDLRVEREGFFLLTGKQTHFDPAAPLEVRLTHLKELAETMNVPY